MTPRRRTHIPVVDRHEQRQIGHLVWENGMMEARTANGELVGKYATRREAASALWATRGHSDRLRKMNKVPTRG
jgi:hypothetical protein